MDLIHDPMVCTESARSSGLVITKWDRVLNEKRNQSIDSLSVVGSEYAYRIFTDS